MDQKYFIRSVKDMETLKDTVSGVYFGSEFCVSLLPSLEEVDTIVKTARNKSITLHLVTPILTDAGMGMVRRCIEGPLRDVEGCEVVANDIGLLRVIALDYPWVTPVMGRLYSYQRSDPSNEVFLRDVFNGEEAAQRLDMLRSVITNTTGCRDFLEEMGVKRVELNNVPQGIRIEAGGDICYSLHLPFVFVSSSRFCPTLEYIKSGECEGKISRIAECHRECRDIYLVLKTRRIDQQLYLYGNTIFYVNDRIPSLPEVVDRIVIHGRPM